MKTRLLLLGLIGAVVCVVCFALIPVLVPGSNDPALVANLLGTVGGVAGALGGAMIVLALIRRVPKD